MASRLQFHDNHEGEQAVNPSAHTSLPTRASDCHSNLLEIPNASYPHFEWTTASAPNLNEADDPLEPKTRCPSRPTPILFFLSSVYDGSSAPLLQYPSGLHGLEGPTNSQVEHMLAWPEPILTHGDLEGLSLSDFEAEDTLGWPVPVLTPCSPPGLALSPPVPAYDGQQAHIHPPEHPQNTRDAGSRSSKAVPSSEGNMDFPVGTLGPFTDVCTLHRNVNVSFYESS